MRRVLLQSVTSDETLDDQSMCLRWPALALHFNNRYERRRLLAMIPRTIATPLAVDTGDNSASSSSSSSSGDWPLSSSDSASMVEQIDFLLDSAATSLCNIVPADTVRCTIDGVSVHCSPVHALRITDRHGVERRYVRFIHLTSCKPSAQHPVLFGSPNLVLPVRASRLEQCERDEWLELVTNMPWFTGDSLLMLRADRAPANQGYFVSLYVEASHLILNVVQHYVWHAPHARTLRDAIGSDVVFAKTNDLGYLLLDYLFATTQHTQRSAEVFSAQIDHLMDRFAQAWTRRARDADKKRKRDEVK